MKKLIILTFLVSVPVLASIKLPQIEGRLLNNTPLPTNELALKLEYTIDKDSNSRVENKVTRIIRLDDQGRYHIDAFNLEGNTLNSHIFVAVDLIDFRTKKEFLIASGMDFVFDPILNIEGLTAQKKQTQHYEDFLTEISFYDWTNMSIVFKTPNNKTFKEYVEQIFIEKGFAEFVDNQRYRWDVVIEEASYVMNRSSEKRYWESGRRHYFGSRATPNLITAHNAMLGCGPVSYYLCLVNNTTNSDRKDMRLEMGWDNYSSFKRYGFIATKAYDVVKNYMFMLDVRINVFSIGTNVIHKTFYLNDKRGNRVSDPEFSTEFSMNMNDIFIHSRDVELLPVSDVQLRTR